MSLQFLYRVSRLAGSLFPLSLILPVHAFCSTYEKPQAEAITYLKSLSIEQLLQTQIISVSKKSESFFITASAVTVITDVDIKRAGIRSIPEALRLVPGLNVANIDGSRHAVSARGFNEYYANKLLVMIDGRSIYTPLFSGVYWNAQDTLIEDIDRIEVIRGSGATVWGANAVNGVINIITKNSMDTLGGLVSATVGSHERPLLSTRYGGKLDDNTTYRVFAKGFQHESHDSTSGGNAHDQWKSMRAGFRIDRNLDSQNTFSLQGEAYTNEADYTSRLSSFFEPPYSRQVETTEDYGGGHLLTTWKRKQSATSTFDLQLYFDHTRHEEDVFTEIRDTIDFELKHHIDPVGPHDIVWGIGYRWSSDEIDNTFAVSFNPDNKSDTLWSAFIQDDINVKPDVTWITVGTKLEHNDYSGFEIQPNIRVRVLPSERQTLWAAISRAVRSPSRSDQDIVTNLAVSPSPVAPDTFQGIRLQGNNNFDSEELYSYELGYRWQATDNLLFDIAAYYNDYNNVRSFEFGEAYEDVLGDKHLNVSPLHFRNGLEGQSHGFELQTTWQVLDNLKLYGSYTYMNLDFHYKNSVMAGASLPAEIVLYPKHQFQLRGYLDLSPNISCSSELYYVSELEDERIDDYFRLDLQMDWRITDNMELSIGVENIFEENYQEFIDRSNIVATEVPRQYWMRLSYIF